MTDTATSILQMPFTMIHQASKIPRESIGLVSNLAKGDNVGALTAGSQIVTPFINASRPFFKPVDPFLATVDRVIGADLELRWQEFNNQLTIFLLVPSVASSLKIKRGVPLSELVRRAYDMGEFLSVWSVEGLGHTYGDFAYEDENKNPHDVLTDPAAIDVESKALTMLNAGIGLAIATPLLKDVRTTTPAHEIDAALLRILELDRENATPGFDGAAIESMGLVTGSFHPKALAPVLGRALERVAPEVLGYFWRGVGRSQYFSLTNIVPCSEIDWKTIAKPAPNEEARKNYIAGLAWALTVVNMKQPQIMANVLKRHGEIVSRDDAFANGVASSIIMRHDTTPNAPFVQDYLNYQPKDQRAAEFWETQIRQPGLKAVNEWYPVLKERRLLGQVFQYHPLSSFPNIG